MSRYLTLPETVLKMVREGKTHTPEFALLVAYYGRDRLRELYKLQLNETLTPGVSAPIGSSTCTWSSTQIIAPPNSAPKAF